MYLKAIEIQGFKSFADKTRLTFEKDITAIVGPNGSGKSNISDAILWVMGEQRTRALRGTKMEDVIFGGTEKRNKLGFAQVSLIIDNSAHILDYESPEVTITRRYFRSGESEYYINKDAVRLKDINSLLMDTGLGRDGYSIIGQGRISEIISTKSTDRREVFEEAAGISRYRYRKEEAEHRLEKTEDNLLRINDKIDELELQVGPLKKQSETAKKYLVLHDELRIREISLWSVNLERLHAVSEAVALESQQVQHSLEKARAELEALYASSESISERMRDKNVEADAARERLSALEAKISAAGSDAAVLHTRQENKEDQLKRMLSDISEQESRTAELRRSIAAGQQRIEKIQAELKDLLEEIQANSNVIDGCRMKLKGREASLNELTQRVNSLEVEGRSMDSRISMLESMEREYEGYSKAVKTVMREAARGTLKGIHGPVANLLKADKECALAIEIALGAAAQFIVVGTQNDGRNAIELLKRQEAGRATFQPVDTIRGSVMRDGPENDPGFVGIAYDLVDFDEKYKGIVASLLGRTVVAETLTDAIRMSKANDNRLRIVTLDGQMINAGGSLTGGSTQKGSGILSRANELQDLKKKRARSAENEKTARAQLEEAQTSISRIRYTLDTALQEQTELTGKRSGLESEERTTAGANSQLDALLQSLSGDSEVRRKAVEAVEEDIAELKKLYAVKNDEIGSLNEQAAAIRSEIDEISKKNLELEGKRSRAQKEAQRCNNEIVSLERDAAHIDQRRLSAEMEEKQIIDKLWDNYELSRTAALEIAQPVESVPKASREISDLKRQISALGTPNLGAIEEYEHIIALRIPHFPAR